MRYVVTGGLGFIGSHLAERLVDSGHTVWVIDDRRSSVVDTIDGATVIDDQVTWADWPDKLDGIFHLAGPVGPVGVLDHAGYMVRDVVDMAYRCAEEALVNDCPLVFVSTSEVYGEQVQPVDEAAPTIFKAATSARKEYAVAKLAAETMLINNKMIDARIVRPFNVAGPRQSPRGGFVVPRFIRQARNNEPITVYRPGTQERAFTHVLDIVDGIGRVMRKGTPHEVYNLGNPHNVCTIWQLATEIRDIMGSKSEIQIVDPQELWGTTFREAPDKIPHARKAWKDLQWVPSRSRADVILDAIASL